MPGRPVGGEFGVEGRRKGDGLGDPNDRGDGLKVGLLACIIISDWLYRVSFQIVPWCGR